MIARNSENRVLLVPVRKLRVFDKLLARREQVMHRRNQPRVRFCLIVQVALKALLILKFNLTDQAVFGILYGDAFVVVARDGSPRPRSVFRFVFQI